MPTEQLTAVRNHWIDHLVGTVVAALWPRGIDRLALAPELREPLWRALLLAYVAEHDVRAVSSKAVARALVSSGLIAGEVEAVAAVLVESVYQRVRLGGVPGQRWWDVQGLKWLLLELWTARRSLRIPRDQVRSELRRYWEVTSAAVVSRLLTTADAPYARLPAPLSESSATGTARRMLTAARVSELEMYADESRFDLQHLGRMLAEYQALVALLENGSVVGSVAANLRKDLQHWEGPFRATLESLTSFEMELLAVEATDLGFRDRCLDAGARIYHYDFIAPGALPATGEQQLRHPPAWMQDQILNGGARFWHDRAGPLPLWLATAENAEHERLLEPLRHGHVSIAGRQRESAYYIDLHAGDDRSQPLVLPFTYSLDYVTEAWQMLLAASVGVIRLFLLRLTDDGRLWLLDTVPLPLPPELCEELTRVALASIRAAVGNDMDLLTAAFTPTLEDIASGTFDACERAKGEDMLDELTLAAPPGVSDVRWRAFQEASRFLARYRANRIRQAGAASDATDPVLKRAVELRARKREEARSRMSPRPTPTTADRAAALPPDTALVHLFAKGRRLGAVWLASTSQGGRLEHFYLDQLSVSDVERLINKWRQAERFEIRRAHLDLLQGALAGIGGPVADALLPLGIRRLVLSPIGSFDLTPLHAAPIEPGPGARTLMDVFDEVHYAPSMRILDAAATRTVRSDGPPLLVGGSTLPGVNAELEALQAVYPHAQVLQGTVASPQRVLAAVRGARILHIACHGRISDDWWANGAMLSGDDCLSVADLLADGDLTGVEAVVLNACYSGTHRSSGIVVHAPRGFDAACLARGAQLVVSTLWEVSDVAALAFSVAFHTALDRSGPSEAFRQAVEYLRHGGELSAGAAVLEDLYPGWADALAAERRYGLWSWGAFKLSGLVRY
ncbi:CHAT domain-containing protein [Micromonospora sp. NPDC006431]|uniref:CHAT domain-containing protein n=1 Tax=Micromonospora sp. NPDC006431 TaxID=3364235 RepID=UPI0036A9429F